MRQLRYSEQVPLCPQTLPLTGGLETTLLSRSLVANHGQWYKHTNKGVPRDPSSMSNAPLCRALTMKLLQAHGADD